MTNSQSVLTYTNREVRRSIMAAISVMKPDMLIQIIHQTDLFPVNQFKLLSEQLIRRYCSRFVVRLSQWSQYSPRPDDLLYNMTIYHTLWEGFSSDEPWAESNDKTIAYFLDTNYRNRAREMNARF